MVESRSVKKCLFSLVTDSVQLKSSEIESSGFFATLPNCFCSLLNPLHKSENKITIRI